MIPFMSFQPSRCFFENVTRIKFYDICLFMKRYNLIGLFNGVILLPFLMIFWRWYFICSKKIIYSQSTVNWLPYLPIFFIWRARVVLEKIRHWVIAKRIISEWISIWKWNWYNWLLLPLDKYRLFFTEG